jgi:hypothetical protein
MGRDFTFMLLIDALRVDYVERMPFLRSLARQSAVGALRECFGFVPRQAYFGGLDASTYGYTNMYRHDPASSPFRVARGVATPVMEECRHERAGVRAFVEETARQRMAPFERSYAGSVQIPLSYLPLFDPVEKFAPWDRRCGYTSLFEILDAHGMRWRQLVWPETNRLVDHSDEGIVEAAIAGIDPEERFFALHLQELDCIGHMFGPESVELDRALAATDLLCRRLFEALEVTYERVNVVLFGDHGMVSVTRTLDLEPVLRATGLIYGVDYAYFLDSTMARFWFYRAESRTRIETALADLPGGRLLGAKDLVHYGIAGCDSRNAEAVFLADPGVLIFPNFFQASGDPIPGMHGYDPDIEDNLGFFMVHDATRPETAGQQLGRVDPPSIFPLLLELCGLESARFTQTPLPMPKPAVAAGGTYTVRSDPAADALVAGHLKIILEAIKARFGPVRAVVLGGSFGRGEGGVMTGADGRLRPVNDYDLMVVDPRDLREPLRVLGEQLRSELGIDFVDLGWLGNDLSRLPATILNYDLRHGSRVIEGDTSVLDAVPTRASGMIPPAEFVRLLLNRAAGVLSGLQVSTEGEICAIPGRTDYLTNQIVKLLIAIGDWHLHHWRAYTCSYRRRADRFQHLAPGAGLRAPLVAAVGRAYAFKCAPTTDGGGFDLGLLRGILPDFRAAFLESVNAMTSAHTRDFNRVLANYLAHFSADPGATVADNRRCLAHSFLRTRTVEGAEGAASIHHTVMAAVPELLDALRGDNSPGALVSTRAILAPVFNLPALGGGDAAAWDRHRELVVTAWFAVCH